MDEKYKPWNQIGANPSKDPGLNQSHKTETEHCAFLLDTEDTYKAALV